MPAHGCLGAFCIVRTNVLGDLSMAPVLFNRFGARSLWLRADQEQFGNWMDKSQQRPVMCCPNQLQVELVMDFDGLFPRQDRSRFTPPFEDFIDPLDVF